MSIIDGIAIEGLELLEALINAFDEPHYGDLETARDSMFEAIEKARPFLAEADRRLKAAGRITRPSQNSIYRRVIRP